MTSHSILVLGAAYGLLPSVRIALAGHRVTVVCRSEEQVQISTHGATVTFLDRRGQVRTSLKVPAHSGAATQGLLGLVSPETDPADYDLVLLAMGEPHYAEPEVASLVRRIADARRPVISLMNLVPPPFLARLGTLDVNGLRPAYAAWDVWQALDPELVTAASPDVQAVRPDPTQANEIAVTLASNFKVAPFQRPDDDAVLKSIAAGVSAYRLDGSPLPARILAHEALHVPLAKWPMLIAGNCRCLHPDGSVVSIRDAVAADPDTSKALYNWTLDVVARTGASPGTLVPFDAYFRATAALSRPSSFARAISSRAKSIERIDKMVQLAGRALGSNDHPILNSIVDYVDNTLGR
jgi:hypothetical protein